MQNFRHPEAAIVLRGDVGAMLSLTKPCEVPEEYYTEIEFLSPYEILLLSAIMLSQVPDAGCSAYTLSTMRSKGTVSKLIFRTMKL
jgi:hypothetical protein